MTLDVLDRTAKPRGAKAQPLPVPGKPKQSPGEALAEAAAGLRQTAADFDLDRRYFGDLAAILDVARNHVGQDPERLGPLTAAAVRFARTYLRGARDGDLAGTGRPAVPNKPLGAEQAPPVPAPTPSPDGPDLPPLTTRAPSGWYRALATEQAARWGYATSMEPETLASYIRHHTDNDTNLQADVDLVWALARPLIEAAQREGAGFLARLQHEERLHTITINERDHAEAWADNLANAIGDATGIDLGEYSNLNDPRGNALRAVKALDPIETGTQAALGEAEEQVRRLTAGLAALKRQNRRQRRQLRRAVRRECTALCDETENERDQLLVELAEIARERGHAKTCPDCAAQANNTPNGAQQ